MLRKVIEVAERTQFGELMVPKLDVLGDFRSIKSERKTVLVVSHEGSRTGAPILSYNLVGRLLERYNVVALFLGPGPLLRACHAIGAIVVGPTVIRSALLSRAAVKQITNAVQIEFALVNSIESRSVLAALAKHHVPTVSLIHEFAAYTRPHGAFPETVRWSGQTVFSSPITRANAVKAHPDLATREYPVIPQGRCILPEGNGGEQPMAGEIYRTQRVMRPAGFAAEGIVVLGAGFVQFRKGLELFIECACRVRQKAPDLPFRFIWVGKGYDPEEDVQYSAYLADQICRAGLEEHVHFVGEVAALEAIYAAADIFVLSSRLDPLPNVAIDALAKGLPVVCFDKATGMADILNEHGLGEICVAAYLDTEDMACKILALAQSKALRESVSKQTVRIAAAVFDIAKYAARIEQLALIEVDRLKQAKRDVDTIVESGLFRPDYYCSPDWPDQRRDDAIRTYVRTWAGGVERRKLFPGFHPGIYLEQDAIRIAGADPLADYVRAGQPQGPWKFGLITAAEDAKPRPPGLRVGLHIHAYYPELFPEIIQRLKRNKVRPDLMISVTSESARSTVGAHLGAYAGGDVEIRVVPNRGRDLGPFLTEFGERIRQKYDLIGHLHTKKTTDVKDKSMGRNWYRFLLENLLGERVPMADIIIGRMAADPNVGLVFPDDPYIVGWGRNLGFAGRLLSQTGIRNSSRELCFPVGTMFWARPGLLKALFDLNLNWEDYPEEPLPYDGSMLHALERLFGIAVTHRGGSILLTNVPGVTR